MAIIGKITIQFKLELALRLLRETGFLKNSIPIDLAKDFSLGLGTSYMLAKVVAANFGFTNLMNSLPRKLAIVRRHIIGSWAWCACNACRHVQATQK